MKIKEFVKKVLNDLVSAVEDVRIEGVRNMILASNKDNRTVEFNIAVSVEHNTSAGGKTGIRVLEFIEAGGDISKESKNSTVSRIKFGVNIDSLTKIEEQQQRQDLEEINRQNEQDSLY